jgi:putative DNA primase/helicase
MTEKSRKDRPPIVLPPALAPLTQEDRWVVWSWVIITNKDGTPKLNADGTPRRTKPPFKADAPDDHASTTDAETWGSFEAAIAAYNNGRADGIGFVLTDSDITCSLISAVDIDDCRNATTGELHTWAVEQVKQASSGGGYTEITPSEEGIRIIGIGTGGPLHCAFPVPNANGVRCELYRRAERYITVTGRQIGTAVRLGNIDARLDALHAELGGDAGPKPGRKDARSNDLNERALANLDKWVKQLFPTAKRTRAGGYRVKSTDLGRDLEEDLSITTKGIKYFGIADMGDPRQGRRTPVELISEWQHVEPPQAAAWLERALGREQPPPPPEPPDEPEATDADVEITRLAKLNTLDYERERIAAAEKLEIRASILDRLVAGERERLGLNGDGGLQDTIAFPEPEPWPEPVNGAELLDAIADAIGNHVIMAEHSRTLSALWAAHTYLLDCFLISPRLGVRSPVRRCGKTTLLDVLARLVLKPLPTANITVAALFRVVESHRPCLLADEAETYLKDNEELRGVLNSGHRRGGAVLRTVGDDHEVRAFATYGACAIALIGDLPGTLTDRAICIDLKRRLPTEKIEPFRLDRTEHLDVLARKVARWAKDHAEAVRAKDPEMPPGIFNRDADNLRPLLAIAEVAGDAWPERARKAAVQGREAKDDDGPWLEMIVGDIHGIFGLRTELRSAELVTALVALESRPWAEMGRSEKPLTQAKLARMLKPLGIAPQMIGPEAHRQRGYLRAHFEEAFRRYLGLEEGAEVYSRTERGEMGTSDVSEVYSPQPGCALAKCEKPNNDGLLDTCTLRKGGAGERSASRPKPKSDDLPYTGPLVPVPDLGPDPLDEHGEPIEPAAGPGLSVWDVYKLAPPYADRAHALMQEQGSTDPDLGALNAELRQKLADLGVPPERIAIEFERVMAEVYKTTTH